MPTSSSTDTWTGRGDGSSWADSRNWSNGVPTSSSDVVINGNTTINCPSNISINSLTTHNSNIQLSNVITLTVAGTIDLEGSYPSLTIQSSSSMNTVTVTANVINMPVTASRFTISNSLSPTHGKAAAVTVNHAYVGSMSTISVNNGTNASLTVNTDYSKSYAQGGTATYYPSISGSGKSIACFLAGSMIRTSEGDVAVEDIQIGDEVIAFDWRNNADTPRPVVWVGKAHVNVRHGLPDDEAGWPVRILKDAIDDGVPYKDMLITSEHCLFFKDRFVPVRMLVNGVSIFYDKSITSYDYYHVETEHHSVITADGMLTESYLDTGNRSSFRQEGRIATLRGAVKSWEEDAGAPLGVERSFVEPLFRAIEWREDQVSKEEQAPAAPELTSDPDLHLVTETGAVVRPMRKTVNQYSFMLPPDTQFVRIVSRASRPSDVIGPFVDDRRYMGVAVADVHLLCAKKPFEITSHLQSEKPGGWHATDWTDCAWTSGNAELPLGDHLTHGKMGILSMTVRAAGPYIVINQKSTKTAKSA